MASDKNIKPEEFTISIQLPNYVIEELDDVAQFHDITLKEEVTRAVLKYHAQSMADLIAGKLK